ncbi:MAG TPA: sulfite exporter TauE/SafE family protein [Pseudomonadales bacterium]|jgi:uncharacterized membrane protein YfcA|nr:sulfite exporter TauE/SafE family protein [Pseudomonadales bacterium]
MDLVTTVSGFFVGLLVGATGVGGGSLMTPLLVLVMGVAPATAVGTDLLYASLTKVGGAWAHGRRSNIDWRICGLLATGSLPAAAATLLALSQLSVEPDHYALVLKRCLGVALMLSAAALLLRDRLHAIALRRSAGTALEPSAPITTVVTGAVVGALVTATSVGAGALGVAALLFLYPKLATTRIVGTDIAHAVPLTMLAGLGHASLGGVDLHLLGNLLLGSLPGVWLGSHLSRALPEQFLRILLACVLVLVATRLFA